MCGITSTTPPSRKEQQGVCTHEKHNTERCYLEPTFFGTSNGAPVDVALALKNGSSTELKADVFSTNTKKLERGFEEFRYFLGSYHNSPCGSIYCC